MEHSVSSCAIHTVIVFSFIHTNLPTVCYYCIHTCVYCLIIYDTVRPTLCALSVQLKLCTYIHNTLFMLYILCTLCINGANIMYYEVL